MGDMKNYADWGFRLMSLLIIPALIAVINLYSEKAVLEEKVNNLEGQVSAFSTVGSSVDVLTSKVDSTNDKIDDLKGDIDKASDDVRYLIQLRLENP